MCSQQYTPEGGHCELSESSKGAESNSRTQEGWWSQPLAAGAGTPGVVAIEERAVPSNLPLKYGMWCSSCRILLLVSLSQLSWTCSSLCCTSAYLQNMRNWGVTVASPSISINISKFLCSFVLSAEHQTPESYWKKALTVSQDAISLISNYIQNRGSCQLSTRK